MLRSYSRFHFWKPYNAIITAVCRNIRYPSEINLNHKSREIPVANNIFKNSQILVNLRTESCNIITVFRAKLQNSLMKEIGVTDIVYEIWD